MTKPNVAGVILAAGGSRRFGAPKQLLPIDGKPMLIWVIEAALQAQLTEVVLVLGSRAEDIIQTLSLDGLSQATRKPISDFRFSVCSTWDDGASASLRTGIESVSGEIDAAAIMLGDQPGITTELIETVVAAFSHSEQRIARPVYGQARVPSHPVIIDRSLFAEIMTLEGDTGARQLIGAHPDDVLEVSLTGDAPRDVDTQKDYELISRNNQTLRPH